LYQYLRLINQILQLIMITIQGTYDGVKIIPSQQIPFSTNTKVQITFHDPITLSEEQQMNQFIPCSIFDFTGNERAEYESENLYDK